MNKIDNYRIHAVPSHVGDCEICDERRICYYVDHDFRGASICQECSAFVVFAERILKDAGLTVPTDSILNGPAGSGFSESLP